MLLLDLEKSLGEIKLTFFDLLHFLLQLGYIGQRNFTYVLLNICENEAKYVTDLCITRIGKPGSIWSSL